MWAIHWAQQVRPAAMIHRENIETFPRFGLARLGLPALAGWEREGEASQVKPSTTSYAGVKGTLRGGGGECYTIMKYSDQNNIILHSHIYTLSEITT